VVAYNQQRQSRIDALEAKRKQQDDELTAALTVKRATIDPERMHKQAARLSGWKVRQLPEPSLKQKPTGRYSVDTSMNMSTSIISATTVPAKPETSSTSVLLGQLKNLASSQQALDLTSQLGESVLLKLRQEESLMLELRKHRRHAKPLEARVAKAERDSMLTRKCCDEHEEIIGALNDEVKAVRSSAKHYQSKLNEALKSKERFFQQFCDDDQPALALPAAESRAVIEQQTAENADLKRQLQSREALYNTARVVSTEAVRRS
jgi:hypothetical protein